jgi:hypothetical protein
LQHRCTTGRGFQSQTFHARLVQTETFPGRIPLSYVPTSASTPSLRDWKDEANNCSSPEIIGPTPLSPIASTHAVFRLSRPATTLTKNDQHGEPVDQCPDYIRQPAGIETCTRSQRRDGRRSRCCKGAAAAWAMSDDFTKRWSSHGFQNGQVVGCEDSEPAKPGRGGERRVFTGFWRCSSHSPCPHP